MRGDIRINIPIAVRYYYEKISLSNSDIKAIFNIKSDSTAIKKKQEVIDYFAGTDENPIHSISRRLDTWRAFEAWGLDISELEKRFKKLRQLGYLADEGVKGCTDTGVLSAAHS